MDNSNSIPNMDKYSKYPLELLVGSDRFYNLVEARLEDPNQRNPINFTLLHVAARSRYENSSIVKLLIDRGADVNSTSLFGHTPLHFAVCSRNHDAIDALIKAGATINSKDFLKRTALHFAVSARWSHPPIPVFNSGYDMGTVKTLLSNPETDINPMDETGETPLMWAVKQQHSGAVSALLERGADPNIPNNDKHTPLHEALSTRKLSHDTVLKLLGKGAGIYGVDKLGLTPVDILLCKVEDEETLLFAKKCIRIITLRYDIKQSLKCRLEKFPLLHKYFKRCSKEVKLMRKQIMYGNVTVHDFACGCFQSQDPKKEIYQPMIDILVSGSYPEYRNLILCGMSNQDVRNMMAMGPPGLANTIS